MVTKVYDINKDVLKYKFDYNEKETNILKSRMNKKQNITIDDLRRISLWKLNRTLNVDNDTLTNLEIIAKDNNITIDSELVKNTITKLVESDGIGFPMASSILKFIRPDIFPIIDIRAYRALFGKKIYSSQYTKELYIEYTKELYKIAEKHNLELFQVDEQLYEFDKVNNKKI
ncbi:MAG: hypothetical protein DRG78_00860 [Epsilonproteobacteria bacterium]|nr:MAG: hypothetical protein DRG78_00860 [Campylobacterota bacterium]